MVIENLIYTVLHKKAFLKVEKQLLGGNTLRGCLHDIDKLFFYLFLSKEKTSKIHRKISKHHNRAKTEKDFIQMAIDWECARYTKPDKPLTAHQTLEKYYPELKGIMIPILDKLKIKGELHNE